MGPYVQRRWPNWVATRLEGQQLKKAVHFSQRICSVIVAMRGGNERTQQSGGSNAGKGK